MTVMLSVTVDNAAISPARSTAVALFAGGDWLDQLWLFWVAPLGGALLGGLVHRCFTPRCGAACNGIRGESVSPGSPGE